MDNLFAKFNDLLTGKGTELTADQFICPTVNPTPIHRSNREADKTVKPGEVLPSCSEAPKKEADKDARAHWAKTGAASRYGYKEHLDV